ncbi:hypothetical protein GCM10011290_00740 [Vogesella alkaliphila]|uniref:Uncharacterized protein n=1 Tax=Vogesella alkaliphila TaxID=1193621 RepID=A0ABQ2YCD2_9NEIS|nr:hypothetical protein GCM10011290_00740 [Vogesella alkaliphila]
MAGVTSRQVGVRVRGRIEKVGRKRGSVLAGAGSVRLALCIASTPAAGKPASDGAGPVAAGAHCGPHDAPL